jgi:high frequency lysogenization protein
VLNTSSRQGLNAELTRYTLSLMVLERKLAASKGAMDTLGNRIAGLHRQLEFLTCSPKRCSAPWRASMLM